jgi:hypothetical protein
MSVKQEHAIAETAMENAYDWQCTQKVNQLLR